MTLETFIDKKVRDFHEAVAGRERDLRDDEDFLRSALRDCWAKAQRERDKDWTAAAYTVPTDHDDEVSELRSGGGDPGVFGGDPDGKP